MDELPHADRSRVAVARNAEIDQIAVRQIRAGRDRRHAPVNRVEAVRIIEKIGGRFRTASDARQFGDLVRLDVHFETSLRDRRRDGIVTAPGAERRKRAFVIIDRVAQIILGQRGMAKFRTYV